MNIQQLELFKNDNILGEWKHVNKIFTLKTTKTLRLGGWCLHLAKQGRNQNRGA